jgi:16S rRNA (guanine(966)-N(2))-methyltransferase RsmD
MRVIAGTARGRTLKAVPGTTTRPTTDKVKEAIFSMIGPYFDGGRALDLFAGTGGLGIEAISRGIDKAVFIDADRKAIETIQANLATVKFSDQAAVFRNDSLRAVKKLGEKREAFDLVFLDPPYVIQTMHEVIAELQELGLVHADSVIVVEHDAALTYPEQIGAFTCTRRATYGDTAISIYRNTEEDSE